MQLQSRIRNPLVSPHKSRRSTSTCRGLYDSLRRSLIPPIVIR
ncbi:uncharacterized protein CCOS01_14211 [Colletotrichum costaricense]|uniref:Uncharacterized protein n=1 Tax=Colletotrichum costaricense TaxID=1209916 RepID=A0AAJ0DU70_9PEZI|nr:uncharacterized protein CCOS01_14211 [Colletotrichum costaricense]KAK1513269.1 hypothetical protein CCOS01_14211 [Colletotrichum costaricense]